MGFSFGFGTVESELGLGVRWISICDSGSNGSRGRSATCGLGLDLGYTVWASCPPSQISLPTTPTPLPWSKERAKETKARAFTKEWGKVIIANLLQV
ncbi:pre-mRNA-processing ATP-dependent RNA helicase PRP5 [Corchorus olitorius]|uniref:Pre-mRNA-processing ATP-dependent RNA helicase PRP5 n=1 Tax=Corchorus olitorius TaxID=93759 RepID=A0A1R3GZ46_9ROSI|nr:pre-mRNA-processing ATP-dependent RNA helicase PRP5 [Corchorus olitorius]